MKKFLKWLIVIIPLLILIVFVILHPMISNSKKEDAKVNTKEYTTKDGRVTFLVPETYKSSEKGDYDLYLNNNDAQIIGAFTYTLKGYVENTSKQILDKQINYFIEKRKDMKLFKKETTIDMDDKVITKVEYYDKNDKNVDCIFVFSTIDFKADDNYTVYVNENLLKKDYEEKISEMIDILKSAKLKQ